MSATLKTNKAQVASLLKLPAAVLKAATAAMRNAGDKAQRSLVKAAQKRVQSKKNLKSAFVRAAFTAIRPQQGGSFEGLTWKVRVYGRPIPLSQYPHGKGGRKGLRVRVNKGGGGALLPHAFVGYGNTAVLMRLGKERGPLKQLYTRTIVAMLSDPGVVPALLADAGAVMRVAFAAGLEKQLAKIR